MCNPPRQTKQATAHFMRMSETVRASITGNRGPAGTPSPRRSDRRSCCPARRRAQAVPTWSKQPTHRQRTAASLGHRTGSRNRGRVPRLCGRRGCRRSCCRLHCHDRGRHCRSNMQSPAFHTGWCTQSDWPSRPASCSIEFRRLGTGIARCSRTPVCHKPSRSCIPTSSRRSRYAFPTVHRMSTGGLRRCTHQKCH
jgi:hypothetical protein